jgi:hypothetical protein
MISAIYRIIISFSRRQKLREEKIENQTPGTHQNVCPFCQCGRLFPGREVAVNDDDNRSVDEDADSEMGSNEN